jgi:small-conductance mechanosensitive channel
MEGLLDVNLWLGFDLWRQLIALLVAMGLSQVVYWLVLGYIYRLGINLHHWEQEGHDILRVGIFLFRSSFVFGGGLVAWLVFHLCRWPHQFLGAVSWVLLFWLLVRLFFFLLRRTFHRASWTKNVEKLIVVVFIVGTFLHFFNLLHDLLAILESIHINIGKHSWNILELAQSIFWLVACLLVGLWIGSVVESRLMKGTETNEQKDLVGIRVVMARISKALIFSLAILIGMSAAGIDLTLLSVFGGALGVGLGLGLQKIASNYISGFVLLLEKSLSLGMMISVDKYTGRVSKINSRFTVIDCLDGKEVLVPNEFLINNIVEHLGFSHKDVRVDIPFQVAYGSDLNLVMRLVGDIAKNHARALSTPEPYAHIKDFASDGINMSLSVWINDPENGRSNVRSDLLLAMWQTFQQHQISIPFPQREVRLLKD